MTIGPAPMIRMLLMSVLFGIFHQLREAIEQVTDVVRPRAGLGMPLKTECGPVGAGKPLEETFEERNMRRPQGRRYGRRVDREAMVLAGNHHLPRIEVLHRMVRAVMAELHLQRLRAGGETHDLVAEA